MKQRPESSRMSTDEDSGETTLIKIETCADPIFLQTTVKDNGNSGFDLALITESNTYHAEVSADDLDDWSSGRKMDFDSYVRETLLAFTNQGLQDVAFECRFAVRPSGHAKLSWHKVPAQDITFHLGSVNLKKDANPSIQRCSVLAQCVKRSKDLESRIRALETDNERLALDRQIALKRLDKCVTAKEEMEKDLYSKFVAVLNSKKKRIHELEANGVTQVDNVADSPQPSTSRASNGNNEEIQDDALYDRDTDDEQSPPEAKPAQTKQSRAKVMKFDSSLNLGDDDDVDNDKKSGAVARRPRRQTSSKKTIPAKPVLPKVSSGNAAGATPDRASRRKSSLRKSGSDNSNKFSDNIDTDDLLDNF